MVRLHGQETEPRITGDALGVDQFYSGFQGVGRGGMRCFGGGGGGGGQDMTLEEYQQKQDAKYKDAEYNKTFEKVARPWLKGLQKDKFSQDERAAMASGRSSADIEQQVAADKPQGLQAALNSGVALDSTRGASAFTDPVAAATDAKQGASAVAQAGGAESRMNEVLDGVRLGQDNMQVTGGGLSALTSISTDNAIQDLQKKSADNASKWNAATSAIQMGGAAYQSSLAQDKSNEFIASQDQSKQTPYAPNMARKVDTGLRKAFSWS